MPSVDRSRTRLLLAGLAAAAVAIVVVVGLGVPHPVSPTSDASAPPSAGPSEGADLLLGGAIPMIDPEPWSAVDWRHLPNAFAQQPKPVGIDEDPASGLDRIDGLIAGGPGLIGWGRVHQPGRNQFNDMGAVHLSANGVEWVVVPLDAGVRARDTSEIQHVATGPGGIVALGGVCCTDQEEPALWRSANGRLWERLPYPDIIGPGAVLTRMVATADRYVLVGRSNGAATIWTSTDGAAWTAVDGRAAGFGPGMIADVARTSSGLVAVGYLDVAGTYDGTVWTSPDGDRWTRVAANVLEGKDDIVVERVVPWAGGWFLVGRQGPHAERVRCEQMSQIGHIASAAGPDIPRSIDLGLSCGWGSDVHWVTADGTVWRRVVPAGAVVAARPGELIEFRLAAAGGPGLVVLGEGADVGAASVFVSADGVTWQPTAPEKQFPVGIVPAGFVIGGRVIAAVADGPSAWIGAVR